MAPFYADTHIRVFGARTMYKYRCYSQNSKVVRYKVFSIGLGGGFKVSTNLMKVTYLPAPPNVGDAHCFFVTICLSPHWTTRVYNEKKNSRLEPNLQST